MSSAVDTQLDESSLGGDRPTGVPPEIFDLFAGPIWAIAKQALGDQATADKVVEATFSTFARSPGSLVSAKNPGVLLFSTARRIVLECMTADPITTLHDAPSVAISQERWRSALVLGRLTDLELTVAQLRHERRLPASAIAAQLGLPVEQVEACEARARGVIGIQLTSDTGLFDACRQPDQTRSRAPHPRVVATTVSVTSELPAGGTPPSFLRGPSA